MLCGIALQDCLEGRILIQFRVQLLKQPMKEDILPPKKNTFQDPMSNLLIFRSAVVKLCSHRLPYIFQVGQTVMYLL